MLVLNMLIDHT